jgi:hypothetical protein
MVFGSKDFNVFEDRAVRAISDSSKNKVVLDLLKRLKQEHGGMLVRHLYMVTYAHSLNKASTCHGDMKNSSVNSRSFCTTVYTMVRHLRIGILI